MTHAANRILIADNHTLCRAGLVSMFFRDLGLSAIAEASDFDEVVAAIAADSRIDFVTVNLGLPGMGRTEGLRRLRLDYPEIRIVVVASTRDRGLVLEALGAGAHGYIPKDLPTGEMLAAFRAILAGHIYVPALVSDVSPKEHISVPRLAGVPDHPLTDRQFEVLGLLSAGRSNKEIARALCIAEGTVKVHIAAAFRLLGVRNRVSAAAALQKTRRINDVANDTLLPGIMWDQQHGSQLMQETGSAELRASVA